MLSFHLSYKNENKINFFEMLALPSSLSSLFLFLISIITLLGISSFFTRGKCGLLGCFIWNGGDRDVCMLSLPFFLEGQFIFGMRLVVRGILRLSVGYLSL